MIAFAFCIRNYNYIFNPEWVYYAVDTQSIITKLSASQKSLFEGTIPYYINTLGGGVKLTDHISSSFFNYPLFFTKHLSFKPGLEAYKSITYVALLHNFIYSLNIFILSRALRLNFISASFAAISSMLFLTIPASSRWLSMACAYSWFPLLLSGLFYMLIRNMKLLGTILICISIWGITSNPLQPFISVIIFSILLLLCFLVFSRKKLFTNFFHLALAGLISMMIMAVAIIPGLLNSKQMLRIVDGKLITGNKKISFEEQKSFIYGIDQLMSIIEIPNKFYVGFPVGHPYIGPIILLFVLLFCIYKTRSISFSKYLPGWLSIFFLLIASYLAFSVFDTSFITAKFNSALPLLDKIRQPLRNAFIYQTLFLILASLSFEKYFFETEGLGSKRSTNDIPSIIIVTGLIATTFLFYQKSIFIFLLIGTVIFVSLFVYFKKRILLLANIFCFLLIFIVTNIHPYQQDRKWIDGVIGKYKTKNEVLSTFSTQISNNDYRINYDVPKYNDWAFAGSYYDLKTTQAGFHPFIIPQYYEMNWVKSAEYSFLLGEKYRISNKEEKKEYEILISEKLGYFLFENDKAKPYAYLANKLIAINGSGYVKWNKNVNDQSIMSQLLAGTIAISRDEYNYYRDQLETTDQSPKGKVKSIEHVNQNKKLIRISLQEPGFLVLNEYYDTNWRAYVNDQPLQITKVNLNQIGLFLPSGEHEINFTYKSKITHNLLTLHRVGLILLGILIFYFLYRNFIKNKSTSHQISTADI